MKRTNTKRLMLKMEALRHLNREVREQQLARALGGARVDCGALEIADATTTLPTGKCPI